MKKARVKEERVRGFVLFLHEVSLARPLTHSLTRDSARERGSEGARERKTTTTDNAQKVR